MPVSFIHQTALSVITSNASPVFDQDLLDRSVAGLVRHLFPEGTPSRIPLVSVTGTTGKTTTCTLIERIMHTAGYETARAGTTGLFRNGEWLEFGDMSGGLGHHKVLESPEVQLAVLETARGAATGVGLAFDACEVTVCTNVSAEHIGLRGIETVADMAELKEFIVQRARGAVVLNADNAYSAGMLPRLTGRQAWLVSAERTGADLLAEQGDGVKPLRAKAGSERRSVSSCSIGSMARGHWGTSSTVTLSWPIYPRRVSEPPRPATRRRPSLPPLTPARPSPASHAVGP